MKLALPVTRADCIDGPRPCPHTTCRHHLGSARITPAEAGESPEHMTTTKTWSCSLDFADHVASRQVTEIQLAESGGHLASLREVGSALGLDKEYIRTIENQALAKLEILVDDPLVRRALERYERVLAATAAERAPASSERRLISSSHIDVSQQSAGAA